MWKSKNGHTNRCGRGGLQQVEKCNISRSPYFHLWFITKINILHDSFLKIPQVKLHYTFFQSKFQGEKSRKSHVGKPLYSSTRRVRITSGTVNYFLTIPYFFRGKPSLYSSGNKGFHGICLFCTVLPQFHASFDPAYGKRFSVPREAPGYIPAAFPQVRMPDPSAP